MPEFNQRPLLATDSDARGRISGPHHRSPPVAGDHAILRPRAGIVRQCQTARDGPKTGAAPSGEDPRKDILNMKKPHKETNPKNRKPQPTTVYKKTIRSILSAVESAGYIDGCDEARAKLVEAADLICQKMEQQAARTAKKTEKVKRA